MGPRTTDVARFEHMSGSMGAVSPARTLRQNNGQILARSSVVASRISTASPCPRHAGRSVPSGEGSAVAELSALEIADPPALWAGLGFSLHGDVAWVDGVACCLGASGHGLAAWTLRGADDLSELPRGRPPSPPPPAAPKHLNGVVAIDHVVVTTPDLGRTTAAFEAAGIELRRVRDVGTEAGATRQAFFRVGRTIAEVVGPPVPSGSGAAAFYGLAFSVEDLDATAAFLGPRLRPPKPAVQPGRRIATLDRAAGSTVPLAFLSPER